MPRSADPEVVAHSSPVAFLEAAEPVLMADEALNGLPIGIANALVEGRQFGPEPPLLLTVHADGDVIGAALRTPPWDLLLSRMDGRARDALVEWLAVHTPTLPGINGESVLAKAVAEVLADRTGRRARDVVNTRLFELRSVIPAPDPGGRMRVATEADRELVAAWYDGFHDEADHAAPARLGPDHQLAAGKIHLWVDADERPVSLATRNREMPNGASIGPVYTPPEERGHGYATALVGALSQAILDQGKTYASLFTDLANPVSNAIYPRVGYRPIADMTMWRLEPA
jgi:predicted GNAT family acetyltransferase